MRDFVFLTKDEPILKATLRVDIIDDDFEKFTIMWMEGVSGTVFEKYIPWKLGAVITEKQIEERLFQFQPALMGVKYGEETVKTLGVEEHVLTITPTITNGDEASVIVFCKNEFDIVFQKTIELTNDETSTIEIVEGFEYSFKLVGEEDSWDVESGTFTCDGDEAVSLGIVVPIDLPIHELTITPDVTNGSEASVTINGTKEGYSSIEIIVPLEDGIESVVDIYEGYSYDFVLPEGSSWTGGDAPETIVCDDDKAVTLDISIPIDLPVHTLTITPSLVETAETTVTLKGTKTGFSDTEDIVALEDSVDKLVDIYEGYSYVFELVGTDTWTDGIAPEVIVCDGDEIVALGITAVP